MTDMLFYTQIMSIVENNGFKRCEQRLKQYRENLDQQGQLERIQQHLQNLAHHHPM